MRISRRTFLLTVAAAACTRTNGGSALERGVEFLWSQQAADGGFHSSTYGLLRSGQSLTPFVLDALLSVPHSAAPARPAAIDRAIEFIRRNTKDNGCLGQADETAADYPNYATALAVRAILKAGLGHNVPDTSAMVSYLLAQQFNEANGWTPDHPAYGAWGMGGAIRRPPDAGHIDVSMTRYVMEALQAAGITGGDPVMSRALVYLKRSQNPDGGFYFSTVNPEINKAGEANGRFASYGTATADGVLALRAAGVPDTEARAAKAIRWLKEHHQPDRAPGFDGTARQGWASGLRFYYAGVISRALPGLPVELPPQAGNGSYRNANSMVKEDDPLIATAFALQALAGYP